MVNFNATVWTILFCLFFERNYLHTYLNTQLNPPLHFNPPFFFGQKNEKKAKN